MMFHRIRAEFCTKDFYNNLYLLKHGAIYDIKKNSFILNEVYTQKEIRMKSKLYRHQIEASEWLENHEKNGNGCILADDMGLGKTLEILSYIINADTKLSKIYKRKTLIVVPKSILNQWEKEIHTHTTIPKDMVYIYYNKNRRIPKKAWIVLTTHQTLVQDQNYKDKPLYTVQWHRVIIDESHCIRNIKTKVSSCCLNLKKRIGICVSGTPINNYINDLYTQIDFSNIPIPSFGRSFRHDEWLNSSIHLFPQGLEDWRKKYILRRTKKDVLTLPPLTVHRVQLNFSEEEYFAYERAIKDAQRVYSIWNTSFNKTINDYVGVLIQVLRMRQACDHMNLFNMSNIHGDKRDGNCCVLCGENIDLQEGLQNKNVCKDHIICNRCISVKTTECHLCRIDPILTGNNKSTKIDKLIEILKTVGASGKKKTVVFSQWTSMLDIIESRFRDEHIRFSRLDGSMTASEREKQREKFSKENDVFLVSLKAGSVGLNLTDAEVVVLFDPWWNPFIEWQAFDRVHRIGQTHPVTVYCLEIKYSVEDWMDKLKCRKSDCSRIIIGKCEFTGSSGGSSGINKNDVEDMFTYVHTNMDNMYKNSHQK